MNITSVNRAQTINRIVLDASLLFPVQEYGYSTWFNHPGVKITPVDSSRQFDLVIRSDVPRRSENGRYYPGWNCLEASHYLKQRLDAEGLAARYVALDNFTNPHDTAVMVEGESLPVSITPGVYINRRTFNNGLFTFYDIPETQIETYLKQNDTLEQMISSYWFLIGFQGLAGFDFLNYAAISFDDGNIIFLFLTNFLARGLIVSSFEVRSSFPLARLKEAYEKFANRDYTVLKEFKTSATKTAFHGYQGTRRELLIAAQVNARLASTTMIKIFRILDRAWVDSF